MDPRGFPTSLPEFQRVFPDDAACAAYLEKTRWPDGFVCPYCDDRQEPYRFANRPGVLRCRQCKKDVHLTAGTVMDHTHTPLSTWFWAGYLVSTGTPGMSAVQFQRQLGVSRYETAFQILHKLRASMVRPDRDPIGGNYPVEVDEVYIGGKTRGEGRGVHHKAIVVGAIEVRQKDVTRRAPTRASKAAAVAATENPRRSVYAGRLRLRVVPDRTAQSLTGFVSSEVQRGTVVRTDAWVGYEGLTALGYRHSVVVMSGASEQAEAHLPMIHLVFSNLKTWLMGTHHGVSQQHLQAYLNEFVFRFNRRFYPMTTFNSVLGLAAQTRSPTYRQLYSGEWIHPNPSDRKRWAK